MSEIEKLLSALVNMIDEEARKIENNKTIWSYIGKGDWSGAGFSSEEEMKDFILSNGYSNL